MVNIYIVTNTKISSTSQISFHSQPRWLLLRVFVVYYGTEKHMGGRPTRYWLGSS
jgi:hypothetical protein